MRDRYITLIVRDDNGQRLYVVVDRRMIFSSEMKAFKEQRRLNGVDDSINRAFDMAREDKARKEASDEAR